VETADELYETFRHTGDLNLLEDSIRLQKSALDHPLSYRMGAELLANLAVYLVDHYNHTGNQSELKEAISLEREALELIPADNPEHASACINLASSLGTFYNHLGDDTALEEAVTLSRRALQLLPVGHPDRSMACGNLATTLSTRYNQIRDEKLLDEAIALRREALDLLPMGHPDRGKHYANLSASLSTRFDQTGDESLLDEAIELNREALRLRPVGDPDRSKSYINLAVLLRIRFYRTGDENMLDETIELEKKALELRPLGHPDRHISCANLAISLITRFNRTEDGKILEEAIALEKEALELTPVGHPDRSRSCVNLAASLRTRSIQTGDEKPLEDAISLEWEALELRPVGHPGRSTSCANLGLSLETRFNQTGNMELLHKAIELATESLNLHSSKHPGRWRALLCMARTHIIPTYSRRNSVTALNYTKEALASNADNVLDLLTLATGFLSSFERSCTHAGVEDLLIWIYSTVIDLASLVAGFLLDHDTQLQYLMDCRQLGQSAYFIASFTNQKNLGLRLLERARGIVWSQLLHLRDPDPLLPCVPPVLAQELNELLHKFGRYRLSVPDIHLRSTDLIPRFLHDRDVQHTEHARLQQLIREIRSQPGLDDFMRGPSLEELIKVASAHPVVVIVAKDKECQALVIRPANASLSSIQLPGVYPPELLNIVENALKYRTLRHGDSPTGNDNEALRAMRARQPPLGGMLAML
jgi:tetratricopeptide (TPR) repeat protein